MAKNLDFSHLSSSDITFIDSLYDNYRKDSESVDESWQRFFQGFEFSMKCENLDQIFIKFKKIRSYQF